MDLASELKRLKEEAKRKREAAAEASGTKKYLRRADMVCACVLRER